MLTIEEILAPLNKEQRDAVTAPPGPVQIFAGPGSGKTRVLTHRIAYLIATNNALPEHICSVTFTNKAAKEMKERLQKMLGIEMVSLVQVSTSHSLGLKMIKENTYLAGRRGHPSIYADDEQRNVLKALFEDRGMAPSELGDAQDFISSAKNRLLNPEDVEDEDRRLADIYQAYEVALIEANAVDFDDLLKIPVEMMRANSEVLRAYRSRYRELFVDEFQDTNTAQYEAVRLLAGSARHVTIVGDDDQSIFRWRNADYHNILNFNRDYPGATTVVLERNYRSTQHVLNVARGLIQHNRHRHDKNLWSPRTKDKHAVLCTTTDDREEAEYVACEIDRLHQVEGLKHSDFAILYRTNSQSRAFETALNRMRIPYQIANGTAFYDRKEIRDVMAYLKLLVNPSDLVAFKRIINTPARGIGDKSVEAILIEAKRQQKPPFQILQTLSQSDTKFKRAFTGIQQFATTFNELAAFAPGRPLDEIMRAILIKTNYMSIFESLRADERAERTANIEELVGYTAQSELIGMDAAVEFLQETALMSDVDGLDSDKPQVTLATLHKSKGLEFPVVFVAGVEQGLLPHERCFSEEEERCLFYVGITRAKDKLYLTNARVRQRFGQIKTVTPSCFLEEIPPELLQTVELDSYSLAM